MFYKIDVLENFANSQENTFARVSFLISKIEALAQVFSCEFCETFKNTFFIEHLRVTTSVSNRFLNNHSKIFAKFPEVCVRDKSSFTEFAGTLHLDSMCFGFSEY